MEGQVKTIVTDRETGRRKAFGFIKAKDGTLLFFHKTEVKNRQWHEVAEHDDVEFDVVPGRDGKGPRAENVRVV